MSPTLSGHDNTQDDPMEDSVLHSFNLFLSLMTPVEFAKLLRSRVKYLVRTWPAASPSGDPEAYDNTHSHSNKPLPISLDSIRSFTSFFKMQDTPVFSESGANSTSLSLNNIQQHLFALETLLSCVSPKELQNLVQSRLREGNKERTSAIRGLLDIMRCAANDETPENPKRQENSVFDINSRSDSGAGGNGTPSANTCPTNISPGTALIPRVMSPGTRDQSADADDSIILKNRDPLKLPRLSHSLDQQMSQPQSNGQTLPLLSPTVSTSRISSSAVASPIEHANMGDILESQIMSHIKTDSSPAKDKESALRSPTSRSTDSKIDIFPYPKPNRPSRRTRNSTAAVSESSSSRTWFLPEKPRRKSERLSMRYQSTPKSPGPRQSPKEDLPLSDINPPSSLASPSTSTSSTIVAPAGASRLDSASSFAFPRAVGRESPPAPVLRAVDWSNPVRSAPSGSDEDDDDDNNDNEDDAMEEDEEELDELADDSSEVDSRISEIVDGWNSHLTDTEPKKAAQPSSLQIDPSSADATPISLSGFSRKDEVEEPVLNEGVPTLPPDSHSPRPEQLNPSASEGSGIAVDNKDKHELGENISPTLSQGQPISVDLPVPSRSDISPPASTAPEATYSLQPPPSQQPSYPPYYPNSHSLSGHNPYSPPIRPPHPPEMHHQVLMPPTTQPSPVHLHQNTHIPNIAPPSYHPPPPPPPPHHHNINPYPPPPPPTHLYDYRTLPPPAHHIPPYSSQYTTSPWYGNSYYHQPLPQVPYPPPHPSMTAYPHQQTNVTVAPPSTQDQHSRPPQMPLPHSQSYPSSNYPSAPTQNSPQSFPPGHNPQVQYSPSQGQYPPDNHGQYPPHAQSHPYQPPPSSFSSHGPPSIHSQQRGPIHPQLQRSINNEPITMMIPKPPSPIIPPPSGPRPPPLPPIVPLPPPPPPPRSPSPPVKPPEGPKRFFPGRKTGGEGVNFPGNKGFDDPNVRYTDEVGIKETSIIRRRCHNCRSAEAPSWRKSKLHVGKILCNKCGIYESTHMMARPLKTRPRRLLLTGERDYHFEMFKNTSPVTPTGSPTSSSMKRRRKRKDSPTSDNDDDDDYNE